MPTPQTIDRIIICGAEQAQQVAKTALLHVMHDAKKLPPHLWMSLDNKQGEDVHKLIYAPTSKAVNARTLVVIAWNGHASCESDITRECRAAGYSTIEVLFKTNSHTFVDKPERNNSLHVHLSSPGQGGVMYYNNETEQIVPYYLGGGDTDINANSYGRYFNCVES